MESLYFHGVSTIYSRTEEWSRPPADRGQKKQDQEDKGWELFKIEFVVESAFSLENWSSKNRTVFIYYNYEHVTLCFGKNGVSIEEPVPWETAWWGYACFQYLCLSRRRIRGACVCLHRPTYSTCSCAILHTGECHVEKHIQKRCWGFAHSCMM